MNVCYNAYPHLNCGWFQRYSDDPGLCKHPSPHRTAETVQVGDWVEFEPGVREKVKGIELNHDDEPSEPLASETTRKHWGRSLLFVTSFDDEGSSTSLHVRRERSPCLHDPFGRSGQRVYAVR